MSGPSEHEGVQNLQSQIWESGAKAQEAWEKSAFSFSIAASWGLAAGFMTEGVFAMTRLGEITPDYVQYPTVALGGLAGALYILRKAGGSKMGEIVNFHKHKKKTRELKARKSHLEGWVDGPRPLSQKQERQVEKFKSELDSL